MKRVTTAVVAVVLAIVMAMPVTVMAHAQADPPVRLEDGGMFVPLRFVAEAHGALVEWDGANRAAVITRGDGEIAVVPIEAIGGFIENGVSWVPLGFVNSALVAFLYVPTRVERIDLTIWNAENFEDVREPMFSTDEAPGVIAVGFIEHMSDNLGARSAFTYRELEAAVWIVEELLAMGHDWDNIAVQEFTYWQIHDMGLTTLVPLNWAQVTSPMVLGVGREYQTRADRVSQNVVLTLPGQSERMIIVGAHYDSPPYASASDNASGTALLMESAQRMLETEHYYTIVYVFFGAEEVGLVGVYYFLESLTPAQRDNIVMMVNADVVIEGPYIVYGAGTAPVMDEAFFADLLEVFVEAFLERFVDVLFMQYEMLAADLAAMGIDDMSQVLPFDSFDGFVELFMADIVSDSMMVLYHSLMLGILEPVINEVAQKVSDIAAELTGSHDFELISIPNAIAFSSDNLAFLFDGHTIVNFTGLERMDNLSEEQLAMFPLAQDLFGGFTATVLHTPYDEFHFIEYTWPGMMNANLEAFVIFLEAILTGRFS